MEHSADGVALLSADGTVLFDSPSVTRILGYGPSERIGRNVFEFLLPEDREASELRFRQLVAQPGASVLTEGRFLHKDGSVRWLEGVRTNLLAEPAIEAIVINYRDITGRMEREVAVVASERRFRSLFDNMLGAYAHGRVLSTDGQPQDFLFMEVNPAFESLTGLKNVVGKKLSELIPRIGNSNPDLSALYSRVADTGRSEKLETYVDALKSWFSVTVYCPEPDEVVTVFDIINDRKLAEERIRRQLGQLTALREIDRAISYSTDVRLSLASVLAQTVSVLAVDAASVLLLDPATQILEYAAGCGFRTDALRHTQLPVGQGYAGIAALHQQTIHVADLQSRQSDFLRSPSFKTEDFHAYYAVPLAAKGKLQGVLEIFHRQPLDPEPDWLEFLAQLAVQAAIAIEHATLFRNLQRSHAELIAAYDATIEGWSRAMDLRDKESEGHTQRVAAITLDLARALDLDDESLVQIRRGALLHDMGKLGVPDGILLKPGPLTEEEWVLMKKHPGFAQDLFGGIRFLERALEIPRCHHEKWDGSGYPRGLKGDEIPLSARIFAVVDVFDALTSDRPYRSAWTKGAALEHIQSHSGSHFDPAVVEVFMKLGLAS
jgi:PAS domain S-box-containing protein